MGIHKSTENNDYHDAEEGARKTLSDVVDHVNDFVCNDQKVKALRNAVLMQEIGRVEPRNDEDEIYFSALSAFYTKIFVECASKQWSLEATLRGHYQRLLSTPTTVTQTNGGEHAHYV